MIARLVAAVPLGVPLGGALGVVVGVGLLCVLVVCCGQVVKGTWWMPWHREPMKDVGACDMPWELATER